MATELLERTLSDATTLVSRGRVVAARRLLGERMPQRAPSAEESTPTLVLAAVLYTGLLGTDARAIGWARYAYEGYGRLYGPDDDETIEAGLVLADLLVQRGEFDEYARVLGELIAARERAKLGNSADTLVLRERLAGALYDSGKCRAGRAEQARVIACHDRAFPDQYGQRALLRLALMDMERGCGLDGAARSRLRSTRALAAAHGLDPAEIGLDESAHAEPLVRCSGCRP